MWITEKSEGCGRCFRQSLRAEVARVVRQGVRAVVAMVIIDRCDWLDGSIACKHKPRLGIGPIFNVIYKYFSPGDLD